MRISRETIKEILNGEISSNNTTKRIAISVNDLLEEFTNDVAIYELFESECFENCDFDLDFSLRILKENRISDLSGAIDENCKTLSEIATYYFMQNVDSDFAEY